MANNALNMAVAKSFLSSPYVYTRHNNKKSKYERQHEGQKAKKEKDIYIISIKQDQAQHQPALCNLQLKISLRLNYIKEKSYDNLRKTIQYGSFICMT